jgi:hypothetical protein
MKIAHFVPIGLQTWVPPKLGRRHLWNVFYVALRKLNTVSFIYVDASYQVSVHMAKQFQRRIFF